jgi:hypothetical protein
MDDPTVGKTCTRCKVTKTLDQFCRDRRRKDGLNLWCRECKTATAREYRRTEAGRANNARAVKKYAQANPEKIKEINRRWHEANPGYSAEANRLYREQNPTYNADYHRANREQTMARVNRRRARLKNTRVGPVSFRALWDAQAGLCGICFSSIDDSLPHPHPGSPSIDHILPLSKGGTHTQDNLQWAHLTCNIRKGATVPD